MQTLFITSNMAGHPANVSVRYPDASASHGQNVTMGADGSVKVDFKVQYRSQTATATVTFFSRPQPYPKCMAYFKAG